MQQNSTPTLQEIRDKALQHFSMCRLDRKAHDGDEDAPALIVDLDAHRDPNATVEEAWVSALSAAMARHESEITAMKQRHRAEQKAIYEIDDVEERKTERIVQAQRHAAEKLALKERQDAAMQEFLQGYPKHPDFDAWVKEQERKVAKENQGELEGDSFVKPNHADIRGFRHEVCENGVRFRRPSGKGHFTDTGRKISVSEWQDPQTTLAAMQLAQEKWGSFTVFGPAKYKQLCAKLAIEHGFEINNPEMKELIQTIRGGAKQAAEPPRPKM